MPENSDNSLQEHAYYFEDDDENAEDDWVPEWWWQVDPQLDIDGDEPAAEWELELDLHQPHYWDRSKCLKCQSYVSRWRDKYCETCLEEVGLCVRCKTRSADAGDMCDACWNETLCRICGVKPRVSGHRCDTCRKYFERNQRERPSYLIERSAPWRSWRELRERQGSISPK